MKILVKNIQLFVITFLMYCGSTLYAQNQYRIQYIDSLSDIAKSDLVHNSAKLSELIVMSREAKYPKGEARNLLNLGVYYMNTHKIDSALYMFDTCAQVVKQHKNLEFVMPYIYNNRAAILANRELHHQALQQYHKAYKAHLKFNNPKAAMTAKMNILSSHIQLEQPDKVLDIIEVVKNDSLFLEDYKLKSKLYTNTALAHYNKKGYKIALQWWDTYLKLAKSKNDMRTVGYIYTSMADAYLQLQQHKEALTYALLAKDFLEKAESTEGYVIINTMILGMIYKETGDTDNSIKVFSEVLQNEKIDKINTTVAHLYLGDSYTMIEDWKSAARSYYQYGTLIDSLYSARNKDISMIYDKDLELIEEIDQNNLLKQDNELLTDKNDEQRYHITELSVLSFGLLCVLFFIIAFIFYKKNSKSELVIQSLKQKEREMLNEHIKVREQELLATAFSVSEQMQKLSKIKLNLSTALKKESHKELLAVEKSMDQFIQSSSNLNIIYDRMESQYPTITSELKEKYPDLSINDIRHCLLIKLNLSVKESAQLLNVSTHAIKMARKRVKKKIAVPEEVTLRDHLQEIV